MLASFNLVTRLKASGFHLLISLGVAALAAALVFGLWYPGAFRHLAGGRGLFVLVVLVDVVLGPLLTFAVFNMAKGWSQLKRDLAVIAALQLAALAYGLHTVYVARPVALVFEVDRYRVISAVDVNVAELPQAKPEYRTLPLTGPWMLSVRAAEPGAERTESLLMGLSGVDTSQRPPFWQPYSVARAQALAKSRPVNLLMTHYPARADDIAATLRELGLDPGQTRFLPVRARGDWVALMRPDGEIAGYAPFDGFF